jgi:DNA-binding SARP family transcriptional activator
VDADVLRVQLCGDLVLRRGGRVLEDADLPGRQGRSALAVLVLERERAVTRDEIAEAVWPDRLPRSWDDSLNAIVSRLRRCLGRLDLDGPSVIRATQGRYRLVLPDPCVVDVEVAPAEVQRAEAALASDDPSTTIEAATAAETIARHTLLPDLEWPWLEPRRTAIRHLRMRALECRADAYTRQGSFQAAIDDAERVLEIDPFRESAWRLLMSAHSASGNPAQSLAVWERCRRVLAAELGTDPSRETHAVYIDALRMHEPGPRSAAAGDPRSIAELVAGAAAEVGGPDEAATLRRIDAAYAEIRSALTACLDGEGARGLRMATSLAGYWSVRGLWTEGRRWLSLFLKRAGDDEAPVVATAHIAAAEMARSQGATDDADALLDGAQAIAAELADPDIQRRTKAGRAAVALTRGQTEAARELYTDVLRDGPEDRIAARCLTGLGVMAAMRANYPEARERFGASLDAHRRLGDLRNVAMCLSNLAAVAGSQGAPAEARAFLEESLAIRRQLADRPGLALSLVNLGIMLKSAGRAADAVDPLEESLAIRQQLGDRSGVVGSLNSLGDVVRALGDAAKARRSYTEAVDTARRIGDRDKLCLSLLSLTNLETASGDPERAATALAEAVELAVELGAKGLQAAAFEAAAGLAVGDHLADGAALLRAAERLRSEIGAPLASGDREDVDRTRAACGHVEAEAIGTADALALAERVAQRSARQPA